MRTRPEALAPAGVQWRWPVSLRRTLRTLLTRGALVAIANWQVSLIQSVADGLFKLTVAAPLVGGVLLVTIVIGADTDGLDTLDWRVLTANIISSLLAHRIILIAFLVALAVVVVGGSLFVFLIKGGTVAVLVRGDRQAAESPSQAEVVTAAAAFSADRFMEASRALFPRYARLGFALIGVYLVSGGTYLAVAIASRAEGWWVTTLVIVVFFVWITIVNLVYLLIQIVIAADDCGVRPAVRRVIAFLRHERRLVVGVFGVVLGMVALATGASLLAFTALGLIFLIPLAWLAAVPLQLLALVVRALVFQFIGLASIGTYLALYRRFSARIGVDSRPVQIGTPVIDAAPPGDLPAV